MKLEKPELFPAYVYMQSPDVSATRLRGKAYFDVMAAMGYRVEQIPGSGPTRRHEMRVRRPWTFVFMPVGYDPIAPILAEVEREPVSFIIDCHFPILDMTQVTTPDAETYANVAANRDAMLANLRVADVVTCPRPSWAADLASVNSNVFLLPDLELPDSAYAPDGTFFGALDEAALDALDALDEDDDEDEEDEELPDDFDEDAFEKAMAESLNGFTARFSEIVMESAQIKQRRWAG